MPGDVPAWGGSRLVGDGMSQAWWEQSGLEYKESSVEQLAAMLSRIHERGYATIRCHQIWIYLRDLAVIPMTVGIGIWKRQGERRAQLRELAGADDKTSARKPQVTEITTESLGAGLRVMRYRKRDSGALFGVLGYAFRSDEFGTDVQVAVASSDLSSLMTVNEDIDQFVHGMTVYDNPSSPQLAQA